MFYKSVPAALGFGLLAAPRRRKPPCPSRWTGNSKGHPPPISWPSTRAISRCRAGGGDRGGQGSLDAIPKVATGAFPVGFADMNSLIKFLDQNPGAPVTAR